MGNNGKNESLDDNYYKLCPKCGNFSHVSEGQVFCTLCGEKLIQNCPNCNMEIIYPTAKHCHKCGSILTLQKNDLISN